MAHGIVEFQLKRSSSPNLPIEHITDVWPGGLTAKQLGLVGSVRQRVVVDKVLTISSIFEVSRVMGRGSFGTCYSCTHVETGLPCCVKIVKKQDLFSEYMDNIIRHCLGECMLELSVQRQRNVVQYLDFFEGPKYFVAVMEPLEGRELFHYLAEHAPISGRAVTRCVFQLLTGLAHVHRAGIIHRDVKLENVKFRTKELDSPVVLLDFGLCTRALKNPSRLTRWLQRGCPCLPGPMDVVGTKMYTAPEVWTGWYDQRCDVWSTGVLLYIMLTGRIFFECRRGAGPVSAPEVRRALNVDELKQAPPGHLQLLRRMLTLHYHQRASSESALALPCFSGGAGEGSILDIPPAHDSLDVPTSAYSACATASANSFKLRLVTRATSMFIRASQPAVPLMQNLSL
mmetsp:Transcript_699/g.1892  ORF Transcript_699/g.1892 Transcript_699/m.1892 type:complete len:399 (-) Transcript_699:133-1329(-)|eukprot:CAMPEP_0194482574 /NCGR_PEP_ID=MMETSP0253-20130528/4458_1 /TAXON_ID=2966 /ORGANISM="Noctiluca scintillans" /LENGTH=398 /DNA_ID=CAMNT_0039322117 /DNA_START=28 /DNA_END=1224 /DNA_ORIENTATION=+